MPASRRAFEQVPAGDVGRGDSRSADRTAQGEVELSAGGSRPCPRATGPRGLLPGRGRGPSRVRSNGPPTRLAISTISRPNTRRLEDRRGARGRSGELGAHVACSRKQASTSVSASKIRRSNASLYQSAPRVDHRSSPAAMRASTLTSRCSSAIHAVVASSERPCVQPARAVEDDESPAPVAEDDRARLRLPRAPVWLRDEGARAATSPARRRRAAGVAVSANGELDDRVRRISWGAWRGRQPVLPPRIHRVGRRQSS